LPNHRFRLIGRIIMSQQPRQHECAHSLCRHRFRSLLLGVAKR
jgi:hypothetical protein